MQQAQLRLAERQLAAEVQAGRTSTPPPARRAARSWQRRATQDEELRGDHTECPASARLRRPPSVRRARRLRGRQHHITSEAIAPRNRRTCRCASCFDVHDLTVTGSCPGRDRRHSGARSQPYMVEFAPRGQVRQPVFPTSSWPATGTAGPRRTRPTDRSACGMHEPASQRLPTMAVRATAHSVSVPIPVARTKVGSAGERPDDTAAAPRR